MNKKLRVGLIGTGSVMREIYQYLFFHSGWSEQYEVVAAADYDQQALQWFCDKYSIPESKRFSDYRRMLAECGLDAVQVNTPDVAHAEPTIAALEAGCDVMVAKPLAASVSEAHAMIQAARNNGRLLGVDFHKRQDPRVIAAAQRAQSGELGEYQNSVWFMLDRLLVADPNHQPRFFASSDFAEKNSPLTFLSTHMLDTLLWIVRKIPERVRARSWSQKLPNLQPKSINGHDMVSLEVDFTDGSSTQIVTGWHLPNAAWAISVGEGKLIFTDGMLEVDGARCGVIDLSHDQGLREPNVLFLNTDSRGTVTGFGVDSPGRLLADMRDWRDGRMSKEEWRRCLDPHQTSFWVAAAVEAGLISLARGESNDKGVVAGVDVEVEAVLNDTIGRQEAQKYYYPE